MHFDALRLVALREGVRIEGTLATENERNIFMVLPKTDKNGRIGMGYSKWLEVDRRNACPF